MDGREMDRALIIQGGWIFMNKPELGTRARLFHVLVILCDIVRIT